MGGAGGFLLGGWGDGVEDNNFFELLTSTDCFIRHLCAVILLCSDRTNPPPTYPHPTCPPPLPNPLLILLKERKNQINSYPASLYGVPFLLTSPEYFVSVVFIFRNCVLITYH